MTSTLPTEHHARAQRFNAGQKRNLYLWMAPLGLIALLGLAVIGATYAEGIFRVCFQAVGITLVVGAAVLAGLKQLEWNRRKVCEHCGAVASIEVCWHIRWRVLHRCSVCQALISPFSRFPFPGRVGELDVDEWLLKKRERARPDGHLCDFKNC